MKYILILICLISAGCALSRHGVKSEPVQDIADASRNKIKLDGVDIYFYADNYVLYSDRTLLLGLIPTIGSSYPQGKPQYIENKDFSFIITVFPHKEGVSFNPAKISLIVNGNVIPVRTYKNNTRYIRYNSENRSAWENATDTMRGLDPYRGQVMTAPGSELITGKRNTFDVQFATLPVSPDVDFVLDCSKAFEGINSSDERLMIHFTKRISNDTSSN